MSKINKIRVENVTYDVQDNTSGYITKDVNNLTNYELKVSTANNILVSIDSSTYVMTMSLRNSNNEVLNTQTVDLPLETMVVGGTYDSTNKKIVLELKNGTTIDVPVGDLINGLQSEITNANKLDASLVDDSLSTNKFVTSAEKTTWNNKSDFSGNYNDLTNKPTIPDVSNYYSKSDIDQRLPILTIFLNKQDIYTYQSLSITDEETLTSASNVINKFYSLGNKNGFLLNLLNGGGAVNSQMFVSNTRLDGQYVSYTFNAVPTYFDGLYYGRKLTIKGNWVNNIFTATLVNTEDGGTFKPKNYLEKNNTTSFTPTNDYNPATKKYVDDLVASISGGDSVVEGFDASSSNPFVFEGKKKGLYVANLNNATFKYKMTETGNIKELNNLYVLWMYFNYDFDEVVSDGGIVGYVLYVSTNSSTAYQGKISMGYIKKFNTYISMPSQDWYNAGKLITTREQNFEGIKIFSSIPQVSSYTAPTQNTELVAKKYVDDSIASAITTTLNGSY